MNFGEFFFSFLGKCLVMLSMTSMTASYATERQKTVSKFFKTVRHIGFRNSVYFQLLQENYALAKRKIHLYTQFVPR